MFTGIVDHIGEITEAKQAANGLHLTIQSRFNDLVLGESIAVDGICLTVTAIFGNVFHCDISPETVKVTTANFFTQYKQVNLERALQLSSRLGGHWVTGHIDQICYIDKITKLGEYIEMQFAGLNKVTLPYVIKKGSIAVNGVSLTINETFDREEASGFSVMLIPHTLECTNLKYLKLADKVNIEFDMMARMVVEQYKRYIKEEK